jgi:hypothetical protein
VTLKYTLTNVDYIRVSSLIDDDKFILFVIHITRSVNFGGTTP